MQNVNKKIKIKKNDTVVVITGKDSRKTGKVINIDRQKGRAYISGLNIVKKHQKPTQDNAKGGIIDKEASINISNLMLFCSKCDKGVKIKYEFDKDNKKIRKCRKCSNKI